MSGTVWRAVSSGVQPHSRDYKSLTASINGSARNPSPSSRAHRSIRALHGFTIIVRANQTNID